MIIRKAFRATGGLSPRRVLPAKNDAPLASMFSKIGHPHSARLPSLRMRGQSVTDRCFNEFVLTRVYEWDNRGTEKLSALAYLCNAARERERKAATTQTV